MGTVASKGREFYFSIHGGGLQRIPLKKTGSDGNIAHIVSTILSQEKKYSYEDFRDLQLAFTQSMKERFKSIGEKSSMSFVRQIGKGLGIVLNKLYRAWNKSRVQKLAVLTKDAAAELSKEQGLSNFLNLSPTFAKLTDGEKNNLLGFIEGRLGANHDLRDKLIHGSEQELISYFQASKKILNEFETKCGESGSAFTCLHYKRKDLQKGIDEIFQGTSYDIYAKAKDFICDIRTFREILEKDTFSPSTASSVVKHEIELTKDEQESLEKLEQEGLEKQNQQGATEKLKQAVKELDQKSIDEKLFESEKQTRIAFFHWIECKVKMRMKTCSVLIGLDQQKVIEDIFHITVQNPSDKIGDVKILDEKYPELLFVPHMVVEAKDGKKYIFLQKEGSDEFFRYQIKKGDLVPEPSTHAVARLHLILKLFEAHETSAVAKYIKESMLITVDRECIPLLRKIVEEKRVKNPELLAAQLRAAYHLSILGEDVNGLKNMLESYLEVEGRCSLIRLLESEREVLFKKCGKEYLPKNIIPKVMEVEETSTEQIEAKPKELTPEEQKIVEAKPPEQIVVPEKPKELTPEEQKIEDKAAEFAGHFPPVPDVDEGAKKKPEAQVGEEYESFKKAFKQSLLKKPSLKIDRSFDSFFGENASVSNIQENFEIFLAEKIKEREHAFSSFNGRLSRGVREKELPSMPLLMVQFARSSLGTWLKEFDPKLSQKEIKQLRDDLKNIFIMDQELQKANGVIAVVKGKDVASNELNYIKEMQTKAQETRHYDIDEDPHLFMFELFAGLYLRPNNVETLKRYKNKDTGVLCQLLMGSGKTFALLPLIALMRADGKTLSTIMLPEALISDVYKQMFERLGGDFNQMVYRFPTLSQETSAQELFVILTRLQALQKNQGCLMLSPDQKHALLNTMTALWATYTKEKKKGNTSADKYMEQIKIASQILALIEQNESVIGDEIDDVLRLNLQYIVSIGPPIAFPREESALFGDTFLEISKTIKDKRFHLSLLEYEDQVLPEVVQRCIKKLIDPQVVGLKRARDFQKISVKIQKYLTIRYKNSENVNDIEEIDNALKILDKDSLDQLAGLRGWALHILPTCLNKVCNKDFGVLKQQESPWAVPFTGPQSPAPTNFSSPFEFITYTLLAYEKLGIPHGYLAKIVSNNENRKKLKEILGEEVSIPAEKEKEFWEDLSKKIQNSKNYNLFLSTFLYPMAEVHKESIASDSHKLVTSSKNFSGFSGTIANKATMPKFREVSSDTVTEAATINILFEKVNSKKVQVEECATNSSSEMLNHIAKRVKENMCRALIDSGGWLADTKIKADDFAQKLLEGVEGEGITSVVYHRTFEENNQQKVELVSLKKDKDGKFTREPFDRDSVADPHRFCIYGMKYSVGTDWKMEEKATCFMTTDPKMDFRSFIQSIFRMRQIEKGQGAVIAYSPDVKKCLFETLLDSASVNETGAPPLTFDQLMRFFITNQTMQVKKETYQAAQHAMNAVVGQQIREKIVDFVNKGDIENAEKLFEKAREILITTQPGAWEQYGEIPKRITTEERIAKDIKGLEDRVNPLKEFGIVINDALIRGSFNEKDLEPMQDSSNVSQAGAQYIRQNVVAEKKEEREVSAVEHTEEFFIEEREKEDQFEEISVKAKEQFEAQTQELQSLYNEATSLGLKFLDVEKDLPQEGRATASVKAENLALMVEERKALIAEQKEKIHQELLKRADTVNQEREGWSKVLKQHGISVRERAVVDADHAVEAQELLAVEVKAIEKAVDILKKRRVFFENPHENPLFQELGHEFMKVILDVEDLSQIEQIVSNKFEEEKERFEAELQTRQEKLDAFNKKITDLKEGLNEDKRRIEELRKAAVLLDTLGGQIAEVDKKLEALSALKADTISKIKEKERQAITRHNVGFFEKQVNTAINKEEEALKNEAKVAIAQAEELTERAQKLQQTGGEAIKAELERLRDQKLSHDLGEVRASLTEFKAKIAEKNQALNDLKKRLDAASLEKKEAFQNQVKDLRAQAQTLGIDGGFNIEVKEDNFQAVEKMLEGGSELIRKTELDLQKVCEVREKKITELTEALETVKNLVSTGVCRELLEQQIAELTLKKEKISALNLKTVQDAKEARIAIMEAKLSDMQEIKNTVNAAFQSELQKIKDERQTSIQRADELSLREKRLNHTGATAILSKLQAIDVNRVTGGGQQLINLRGEIKTEKEKLDLLEKVLDGAAIEQRAELKTQVQELKERIDELGIKKGEGVFQWLLNLLGWTEKEGKDVVFEEILKHTSEADIKFDRARLEEICIGVEGVEKTMKKNIEEKEKAIKEFKEKIEKMVEVAKGLKITLRVEEQKDVQGGGTLKQREEKAISLLKDIQSDVQKMTLELAFEVNKKQEEQLATLKAAGIQVQRKLVVDVEHVVEAATTLASYQKSIENVLDEMKWQKSFFALKGKQLKSDIGKEFSKVLQVEVEDFSHLEQAVKEKCGAENARFKKEVHIVTEKEEKFLKEMISAAIIEAKSLSTRAHNLNQNDAKTIQEALERLETQKISCSLDKVREKLTELQTQITEQKQALKIFEQQLNKKEDSFKAAIKKGTEQLKELKEELRQVEEASQIFKIQSSAIDTEISGSKGTLFEAKAEIESKIAKQKEVLSERRTVLETKMQELKEEKIQLLAKEGISIKELNSALMLEKEVSQAQKFLEEMKNIDIAIQSFKDFKNKLLQEKGAVKEAFATEFLSGLSVAAKSFSTCLKDVNASIKQFQKSFDVEVKRRKQHVQEKVTAFKEGVGQDIEKVKMLVHRANAVGFEKQAINNVLEQLASIVATKVEGQTQEIKKGLVSLEMRVKEQKDLFLKINQLVEAAEVDARARLDGIQAKFQANKDILLNLQKIADGIACGSLGIIQNEIEKKSTLKETIESLSLEIKKQEMQIAEHRSLLQKKAESYREVTLKKLGDLGFKEATYGEKAKLDFVDGQEAQYVKICLTDRQEVEEAIHLHNELKAFVLNQKGKNKSLAQELLQEMKEEREIDFTKCLAIVKERKNQFNIELDKRMKLLVEFTERRNNFVAELEKEKLAYTSVKGKVINKEELQRLEKIINKVSTFDPSTKSEMTECELQLKEVALERKQKWDSGDEKLVEKIAHRGALQENLQAHTIVNNAFDQIERFDSSGKKVIAACKAAMCAKRSAEHENNKKKKTTKENLANAFAAELRKRFGENFSKLKSEERDIAKLFLRKVLVDGKISEKVI